MLKQAAAGNDEQSIQTCWEAVPEHIKTVQNVANIYFAAMISAGAGPKVESALISQLVKHWDDTLLILYADIDTGNPAKHLQTAEQWLVMYSSDAILLRVLGKLAFKAEQLEKAEQYLLKSLHIDASVSAYRLLGEIQFARGDKDHACENFKRGLELASEEVVRNAATLAE